MTYPGLIHDVYHLVDADGQPIPGTGTIYPTVAEYEAWARDDGSTVAVWTAEPDIVTEKLDVPWMSQLGPDAAFAPGDCGPACLAQWLNWLKYPCTVDEVSAQSGLDRGYRYTTPAHLIHAARHWSLDLYWRRYLQLDDLRTEIDECQPCIVLVNYPSLPKRYDQQYEDGHWLLVVGYGTDRILYHDPYWHTSDGAFVEIGVNEFERAWNNNHLNGNSDRQALRLRR